MPPHPDDPWNPQGRTDADADTEADVDTDFDRKGSRSSGAPDTDAEEVGTSTHVLYERQPPESAPAPAPPQGDFPIAGPEAELPTAPYGGKGRPPSTTGPASPESTSPGLVGPDRSLGDLPTAEWNRAMGIVQRFEDEWRNRGQAEVDDFLNLAGTLRPHVLVDLLLIDLEFRRRKGQEAQVKQALESHPELGVKAAAELVLRDYQARQRREAVPPPRVYPYEFSEFPALREELIRRFAGLVTAESSVTLQPQRPSQLRAPEPANRPNLPPEFRVIAKLGEGGMGQVWLVDHAPFSLRVVKVIHPNIAQIAESRVRMLREAMALDRIRHVNAVVVHDVKEEPVPYIEMEYVPGQSVDKLLTPMVPMPLDWIDRILKQLCDVLQVAHERWEIIHRDLKPSNLMLAHDEHTGEDVLKVLDFGLAKFLNVEDSASDNDLSITNAQQTLGTYLYMSPEQAMNSAQVQPSADIYSVGVILYELLTGSRPFTGPTLASIAYQIMNAPAPPFREKNPKVEPPEGIEALVLSCLEKDPAKRPGSARELSEAFHRLVAPPLPEPPPAAPIVIRQPAASLASRLSWTLAFVLVGSVLGLGAYALFLAPNPAALSAHAASAKLTILAGHAAAVEIVVGPKGRAGKVEVTAEGKPGPGVRLIPEPAAMTPTLRRFHIETDPLARTGRQTLRFAAREGTASRAIAIPVELTIEPPYVEPLPAGWTPALPNSTDPPLVKVGEKVYHRAIERTVGDGERVLALLIEPRGPRGEQTGPFYMMRDKVWVGLFAVFARAHPGLVPESPKAGAPHDSRLPVLNVTGIQAQAFAEWLGGKGHGFLPTFRQWDQAAGLYLTPRRRGPFRDDGDPTSEDWTGIAVGENRTLQPVGKSGRDVSPYGCRDMSGNGFEWTRLPPGRDPIGFEASLRGIEFDAKEPYLFDKFNEFHQVGYFHEGGPNTGFRVVIELGPET